MNKLRNMHVIPGRISIQNFRFDIWNFRFEIQGTTFANQRFRFAIGGPTFLLTSACRHAARTISSTRSQPKKVTLRFGIWNFEFEISKRLGDALRLVSEEPINDKQDSRFDISNLKYKFVEMVSCWLSAPNRFSLPFTRSQIWNFRFEILIERRVLSDTQRFQHIAKCNLICHQTRGQKNSTLGPS